MKTVFILRRPRGHIIGIFDTVKLCLGFASRGEKDHTFLIYKNNGLPIFLDREGISEMITCEQVELLSPTWVIQEEEILTGSIEDYPEYDIKFFDCDGNEVCQN